MSLSVCCFKASFQHFSTQYDVMVMEKEKEKKIEFYEMRKCCWLFKLIDDEEMSDGKTSVKVETKQCQINLHFLFHRLGVSHTSGNEK